MIRQKKEDSCISLICTGFFSFIVHFFRASVFWHVQADGRQNTAPDSAKKAVQASSGSSGSSSGIPICFSILRKTGS